MKKKPEKKGGKEWKAGNNGPRLSWKGNERNKKRLG